MDLKDSLPIVISTVALAVTGVSTWINSVRDKRGDQRTASDQINATLKSINENMFKDAKLSLDPEQKGMAYGNALRAILSQQNGILLKHAAALMEQNSSLVTAWEWNTVALAQYATGDRVNAERYFIAATKASMTDYDRALAVRSYATFLFNVQRVQEGRDEFDKAIALLAGEDDYLHYTRAYTYAELASLERTGANDDARAQAAFERAQLEASKLVNPANREAALQLCGGAGIGTNAAPAPPQPWP